MSENGRTGGSLAKPVLFALGAFIVCSALVPVMAALIGSVTIEGLRSPESAHHTGCKLTDSLGAWVRLSCDLGPVSGALAGVGGNASAIGVAVRAFIEFHGVPLTCATREQALECVAGIVALNDHLARHGFVPPSMDEAQLQREGWLATLLGFAGAIIAFLHGQSREREARDVRERVARGEQRRKIELLRTQATEVSNKLQTAMKHALRGQTEEERSIATEKLSLATTAGQEFARDLTTVLLSGYRIRQLQAVLFEVERVRADSYKAVTIQLNEQFNSIEEELSALQND